MVTPQDVQQHLSRLAEALRTGGHHYEHLFGRCSVPLIEQDLSQVKLYVDELRRDGARDLRVYFIAHSQALARCAELTVMRNVNRAAVELLGRANRETLPYPVFGLHPDGSCPTFRELVLGLSAGGRESPTPFGMLTPIAGGRRARINWAVMPGAEEDWSRVVVSVLPEPPPPATWPEERERLRLLGEVVDGLGAWLMVTDRDGKVVLWNQGAEQISGYAREEVLGHKKVWQWLYPDADYRKATWGRCRDTMAVWRTIRDIESLVQCKDGSVKTISWTLSALECGEASSGCIVLGRDLSTQRRPEGALNQREALMETLLGNATVGMFLAVLRSPGKGLSANFALVRMLGYESTAALLGSHYERHLPDEERARLSEAFNEAGWIRGAEVTLLRKDGSPLLTRVCAKMLRDAQGRPLALTGTIEDITERKAAEEALKASEEKYRLLVEGAGEAIFTLSKDGVLLAMNRATARHLGGSPEDFEGKALDDLFPKTVADSYMESLREVIECGAPRTKETRVLLPGGETWFRSHVQPLPDPDGTVSKAQVLALDVTDRKQAEQELLRYQERLQALAAQLSSAEDRECRRIAGELHDEISQSLALALMKLGMLEGSAPQVDEPDLVGELRALIEQALQSARTITSELSPPVLTELGFGEAMDWLAERMRDRHVLAVEAKVDDPVPLDAAARVVLFKAVRELLVNVAKHAGADAATVCVAVEDGQVLVTVADDGRGFPGEAQPAGVPAEGGFGLFNIREQLRRLGGNVEIDSEPGRGTRVSLRVPSAEDV